MKGECCKDGANVVRWGGTSNIRFCRVCGLGWLDPQPTDEELDKLYQAEYFDSWGTIDDVSVYWELKRTLARRLLSMVDIKDKGARVLDVGCATGAFLSVILEEGHKAYGVDINPDAIRKAAELVPGAEVKAGTLGGAGWGGDFFDVVVMSDVLEHLRDPCDVLEQVYRSLKPGGRLVVLTPNISSLSAKLMRGRWIHIKDEHLYHYSPPSLDRLLVKCGFGNIRIRPDSKPMTLGYAVHQFRSYRVPFFSPLFALLDKCTPRKFKNMLFYAPIGEMAAVAEKKD